MECEKIWVDVDKEKIWVDLELKKVELELKRMVFEICKGDLKGCIEFCKLFMK